ncbi:mechanosensitive ion channel domain-containing protein [Parasphingorhabdus cellanae]|uniref:Small-conductance mechanosensitive channel n=1 Tax=Parasphingorhabdus cellanae TaxID=2806553 RepID=A0ABX7T8Y3_9SPHN|nr:mechanosensitive ion channel domain-containing protein [Parasphingorhabdus cellanae]QTD57380.1 mechanosensitive ion channel [Parasphingorhabdus cellanae]
MLRRGYIIRGALLVALTLWFIGVSPTGYYLSLAGTAYAQLEVVDPEPEDPEPIISASVAASDDQAISDRISGIFAEIDEFNAIDISVEAGVVNLTGPIKNQDDAARAESIAQRVSGVVTVDTDFERDLSVDGNVEPVVSDLSESLNKFISALPLIGIALTLALAIGTFGHLLASIKAFWTKITPNIFLAELLATSIRVLFIGLGIFIALDILNATAVLGAVLGGAGVIGLAIGFALRDTVDNYVSSIMLSVRQPFRANDHVLIGDREGRVVRLSSRATILMTLDGNHLRIPNATVFKAEILNYSRNPQRRFTFQLGVDADDDPAAAVDTGLEAINTQTFILDDPAATAEIQEVGDSNILIVFHGWVDQRETDFKKARGAAIRAAKNALEAEGFALPEPIYRLRFDGAPPMNLQAGSDKSTDDSSTVSEKQASLAEQEFDVSPETHVERLVGDERAEHGEADLLDSKQPVE